MSSALTAQVRTLTCGETEGVEFTFVDLTTGAKLTAWVPATDGGITASYALGANLPQYMDRALEAAYAEGGAS